MPVNILARDSIFVLLLWLVGEDVRISDPSGFQFGPNFYLPTILKNVILLNMYFWEIIPSSFVFIKDYEGYDEVSKLAMYWSSQSSEVSTFSVLQNSLWSLFKGAHYLWLLLCLLGELGWVEWVGVTWVNWVNWDGWRELHFFLVPGVSRVARWRSSPNVLFFVIVCFFVFVFVIIFLSVRSCLLLTLTLTLFEGAL